MSRLLTSPHASLNTTVLLPASRLRRPCIKKHSKSKLHALEPNNAGGLGGGGSGDGSGSGRGDNSRPGPEDRPQPEQQQHSWLKLLASAVVGVTVIGLLQPQRLLSFGEPIDTSKHTVAVIIPVLNEASGILQTLEQLQQLQPPPDQVIVVDGGSTDDTVKLVRRSGLATAILQSGRGRAVQMNEGAAAATTDMLCFLHADTIPPKDLVHVMRRELSDPQTVLAGFVPSIEVPGRRLWLMSFHDFISTYYAPLLCRPLSYMRGLRCLFGDQTLFCRTQDLKAVGGFDSRLCIMEDVDLCIRMHMAGPAQQQHQGSSVLRYNPNKQPNPLHSHSSSSKHGSGAGMLHTAPLASVVGTAAVVSQAVQQWMQPRGRIKQVMDRVSVTSGRRMAVWGNLKATYIHMVVACSWYFGRTPEQLKQVYVQLYTDHFR